MAGVRMFVKMHAAPTRELVEHVRAQPDQHQRDAEFERLFVLSNVEPHQDYRRAGEQQ